MNIPIDPEADSQVIDCSLVNFQHPPTDRTLVDDLVQTVRDQASALMSLSHQLEDRIPMSDYPVSGRVNENDSEDMDICVHCPNQILGGCRLGCLIENDHELALLMNFVKAYEKKDQTFLYFYYQQLPESVRTLESDAVRVASASQPEPAQEPAWSRTRTNKNAVHPVYKAPAIGTLEKELKPKGHKSKLASTYNPPEWLKKSHGEGCVCTPCQPFIPHDRLCNCDDCEPPGLR